METITPRNRVAANVDEALNPGMEQKVEQAVYHDAFVANRVDGWHRSWSNDGTFVNRFRVHREPGITSVDAIN